MEGPPSGYWLPIFAWRLRRRSQSIFHADDIKRARHAGADAAWRTRQRSAQVTRGLWWKILANPWRRVARHFENDRLRGLREIAQRCATVDEEGGKLASSSHHDD
jgi:hypothetical protein